MRSTLTERWLDKIGAEWEYERNYDLDRVAITDDATAQIRMRGTSDTHVEDFRRIARAGEHRDLPAIIVARNGKPKDDIGDGIHRTRGLRGGGVASHDAYIVKSPDPMLLEAIRRTANIVLNGKGLDDEERLEHAWHMRKRWPERTLDEVAATCQVSASTLGTYIRREETKIEMLERGVPTSTVKALNGTHLDAIVQHRPAVRTPLAECIVSGKMSGKDATELSRQIRAADSEREALDLIRDTAEQYAARNRRGTPKRTATTGWKRATALVHNAMKGMEPGAMTELQRREVYDSAQALSVALSEFAGELVPASE